MCTEDCGKEKEEDGMEKPGVWSLRHGTLRCHKERGHSLQVATEGSSGHAVRRKVPRARWHSDIALCYLSRRGTWEIVIYDHLREKKHRKGKQKVHKNGYL